jgi:hypothetical protein
MHHHFVAPPPPTGPECRNGNVFGATMEQPSMIPQQKLVDVQATIHFVCFLEHLYCILPCENIKKWAKDMGRVHKHLPFTLVMWIQYIFSKLWVACSDLANIELIINGKIPDQENTSQFEFQFTHQWHLHRS